MINARVQPPLDNSPSSLGDSSVEVIGQGVAVEGDSTPHFSKSHQYPKYK